MNSLKKDVAGWTRWLHIYLSMFSFTGLLFFSITGITLNHPGWIDGKQKVEQVEGNLNVLWVHPDSSRVEELKVVEWLRTNYRITVALSDFRTDDTEYAA